MEEKLISQRFELLSPLLDERHLRLYVAAESLAIGHGGISKVSRITGVSRPTITVGRRELLETSENTEVISHRIRKSGGGRKRTADTDLSLRVDLDALVEPATRGDPESSLRWTSKSVRKLAEELKKMGHKTSPSMVSRLLREIGYSLQANQKTLEGTSHPDRNAQFEHIYRKVQEFQEAGLPVISVDAKKKELVGNFKNSGRELCPKGQPQKVRVYDFKDKALGKVTPYGIYDFTHNVGWVSVGTDHDTATFAVESIRHWWTMMGKDIYPNAHRLLITADSGGSNGYRVRLWKMELQKLANETGLEISISHLPPGTSKWNKIEHRLFSIISKSWRGKPLVSHEVIVNLISSTSTRTGLSVKCELDTHKYPLGTGVTKQEFKRINLTRDGFHGEWNYVITPNLSHKD